MHYIKKTENLFPLKSLEMFKENSTRYEFAAKFAHGRIYNYSPGEFMSYFGAKILLENGIIEEVINLNAFKKNSKHTKRSRLKNGSIDFSILDNGLTKNQLFDTAISFDTIQFESDCDKFLKNFYDLLKKDGIFILSIPNSKINPTIMKNTFTEKSIQELLGKYFKNIVIYYQKKSSPLTSDLSSSNSFPQKSKSSVSVKKIIRRLYSLVDKDFNFFELYFKRIYLKLFPLKISKKQDYIPTSNSNENDYLYFVIVCKKQL